MTICLKVCPTQGSPGGQGHNHRSLCTDHTRWALHSIERKILRPRMKPYSSGKSQAQPLWHATIPSFRLISFNKTHTASVDLCQAFIRHESLTLASELTYLWCFLANIQPRHDSQLHSNTWNDLRNALKTFQMLRCFKMAQNSSTQSQNSHKDAEILPKSPPRNDANYRLLESSTQNLKTRNPKVKFNFKAQKSKLLWREVFGN